MTESGRFDSAAAEGWLTERMPADGTPSKYIAAFTMPNLKHLAVARDQKHATVWIEPFAVPVPGVEPISIYPASRTRNSNLNNARGSRLKAGREALLVRVADAASLQALVSAYGGFAEDQRVAASFARYVDELVEQSNDASAEDHPSAPLVRGRFRENDAVWEVVTARLMPLLRARGYAGDPFKRETSEDGKRCLRLRDEFLESAADQVLILEVPV